MRATTVRWTIYLAALLLVGPVIGQLNASLRAPDGGPDATALLSESPARGLAIAAFSLLVALALGVVGTTLCGLLPGIRTTGLVLAWATWPTAQSDALIRAARSGSPLRTLAIEGVLCALAGVIMAWTLAVVAARTKPRFPVTLPVEMVAPPATFSTEPKSVLSPLAVGAAALAGAIGAWLLAVEPLKGQAVAGAILAGLLAAAGGRLVDYNASPLAFFIAMGALAIAAPLSGLIVNGPRVVAASFSGEISRLAYVLPSDWLAGAFLGIPIGLGWAHSMLDKRIH